MKKISVSTLALAAALLAAPVAHADTTPGWYLGAGVGGTFTPDGHADSRPSHTKLGYDTGWDVNGSAGYAFMNGFRTEAEVWHSQADLDKSSVSTNTHGNLQNTDLFANGFYDFKTGTIFTPYLGAGVGIAFADAENLGPVSGGSLHNTREALAYQGIAGVAAQLDYNWALTADYRYVASTDPKFHSSSGRGVYADNESHNITVGVRYSFGEPTRTPVAAMSPAPRATPRAAAAPAVAPVPQSYMVFFDFNKATLTPEAKRILASAAQDYKKGGVIKVVVTGHTDTVGSDKYNQTLSQKRASAVKAELASDGVAASVVEAVGAGKTGLLVPTADGVREAQNRRAEIVFDKQ